MFRRGLALAIFVALATSASATQPTNSDEAAIRAAALDYVDALYLTEPARVERSVAQDMVKLGYSYGQDGSGRWVPMTYAQLHGLAARYNAARSVPADAPREVTILDVQRHIANVRLKAAWGVDYLLLAKGEDGRWRIQQVLWEGNPRRR